MNLDAALFAFLKGTTAVANQVVNAGASPLTYRIFPNRIPQGEIRPAIRFARISTVRPQGLDGPSAYLQTRFQLDAWATTDAACRALADAVVAAIDGHRGTFGPVNIQHAYIEDVGALPDFDPEEQGNRITMDLVILACD